MEMWAEKPPPHKEIFLQVGEGEDSEWGVTWCQDQINDTDLRYVLAPPPKRVRRCTICRQEGHDQRKCSRGPYAK